VKPFGDEEEEEESELEAEEEEEVKEEEPESSDEEEVEFEEEKEEVEESLDESLEEGCDKKDEMDEFLDFGCVNAQDQTIGLGFGGGTGISAGGEGAPGLNVPGIGEEMEEGTCPECGKKPCECSSLKESIVKGHTIEEYMSMYGDLYRSGDLWDFAVSDVESGSIEIDPDKIYWEIDGRYYETPEMDAMEEELTPEEQDRMDEITRDGIVRAKDREEYNELRKKEKGIEEECKESCEEACEKDCKESCEESLGESFEKVDVETEDQRLMMDSDEDGKVTIVTEPKEEEAEEEVMPDETLGAVDLETKDEIISDSEEEQAPAEEIPAEEVPEEEESSEDELDIDEFDEESFDELGESYLKKVYENVNSYKTTSVKETDSKLFIEGVIEFKSGSKKTTNFVFESNGMIKDNKTLLEGFNKQIARANKSFKMTCNVEGNKLVCEKLNYRYRSNKNLVEGYVRK